MMRATSEGSALQALKRGMLMDVLNSTRKMWGGGPSSHQPPRALGWSSCSRGAPPVYLLKHLLNALTPPSHLPDLHCILHHRHVGLALGRGVDGQLGWWDDEALAQRQPHAFPQGVGEPARESSKGWHGGKR